MPMASQACIKVDDSAAVTAGGSGPFFNLRQLSLPGHAEKGPDIVTRRRIRIEPGHGGGQAVPNDSVILREELDNINPAARSNILSRPQFAVKNWSAQIGAVQHVAAIGRAVLPANGHRISGSAMRNSIEIHAYGRCNGNIRPFTGRHKSQEQAAITQLESVGSRVDRGLTDRRGEDVTAGEHVSEQRLNSGGRFVPIPRRNTHHPGFGQRTFRRVCGIAAPGRAQLSGRHYSRRGGKNSAM